VIFVDANVPMYIVGAEHPNKVEARRLIDLAIADSERLVTDAEVLQEIIHRFVALDRRDAIQSTFDLVLAVVDDVFPVDRADVEGAKDLVLTSALSARDAIHVAVMRRHGVERIMSFDRGFDGIPGLVRLGSVS
jgi:predicted nucleic acid-binding protein